MEDDEQDQQGDSTVVWLPRDDSCESSTNRRLAAAQQLPQGERWPQMVGPRSGSPELRRRMSVEGHNFPSSSSLYQPEGGGHVRGGIGDVVMEDRDAEELRGDEWAQHLTDQRLDQGRAEELHGQPPNRSAGRSPRHLHHREEGEGIEELHVHIENEYNRLLGLGKGFPEHGMQPITPQQQGLESPEELWKSIEDNKERDWYNQSVAYWDKQEASYNGVLGGFEHVSEPDIAESRKFLLKALAGPLEQAAAKNRKLVAIDCGAGVGRVTEQLLLHHFQEVDILEPSRHLLSAAEERCGQASTTAADTMPPPGHTLGQTFCMGLQQFTPGPQRYDCIWIQWALLYLTDDDAIALFQRCRDGLKPDGMIFVKENICSAAQNFAVDKEDSSLTRSNAYMQKLFSQSNLHLKLSAKQKDFPKELYAVHMYALQPKR